MKATNKSLMAQLNEANAAMEETIKSKQALEIEYQQFKVRKCGYSQYKKVTVKQKLNSLFLLPKVTKMFCHTIFTKFQ